MKSKIYILTILIFLLKFYKTCTSEVGVSGNNLLHRTKRQLLFLNQSFFQFNAGVGTPTASKMINVNWAIQAQFTLPWNRTQIPTDILNANSGYVGSARGKRETNETKERKEYENDARLYHFYKYVEDVLNGYGHNGTACMLRALCQLGAEPLHTDVEEDLLHELASFLLTPTNDVQDKSNAHESTVYIQAHEHGQSQKDCLKLYDTCAVSLVDLFSHRVQHQISDG